VGSDAPSCDTSAAPRAPAQAVAASLGVCTLVNLRRLEHLPRRGAYVVVGALPIVGGAGAPARVVALVPPDAPAPPPNAAPNAAPKP
jgi:kynurenine formamidase